MKTSFQSTQTIRTTFAGGNVCLVGSDLYSQLADQVHISPNTLLGTEGDAISTFTVSSDGQWVVVCHASLIIKIYKEKALHKSFKAHEAPVLAVVFDPTSALFATGSADSTIRVWDVREGHCTHVFKGHSGIISALKFHPFELLLASGSDDCKVRLWDLNTRACTAIFDSHVSVIRGLDFTPEGDFLISGARDSVFCKWNLGELELALTVPVFESIECLAVIEFNNSLAVCTGGEKGIFKIWDIETGDVIKEQEGELNSKHEIVGLW